MTEYSSGLLALVGVWGRESPLLGVPDADSFLPRIGVCGLDSDLVLLGVRVLVTILFSGVVGSTFFSVLLLLGVPLGVLGSSLFSVLLLLGVEG